MRVRYLTAVAAFVSSAFASNATDQVIDALETAGFAAVATLLNEAADKFPLLQTFFDELGGGNKTFFVPDANTLTLSKAQGFLENGELLLNTLNYHVVQGLWEQSTGPFQTSPSNSLLRSTLTDNNTVFLPGGSAQLLAATKQPSDGSIHFQNQDTDVTITHSQSVSNLNIILATVNGIFDIPGNVSSTLSDNNLTMFHATAQKAGLFDGIQAQHGVTLFVPSDAAFSSASAVLSAADPGSISTIVNNHVINDALYSSDFNNGHFTAVSGQPIKFSTDAQSTNVTFGGNVTARVLRTDVLCNNGAVHVIDVVNTNLNGANVKNGAIALSIPGNPSLLWVGAVMAGMLLAL